MRLLAPIVSRFTTVAIIPVNTLVVSTINRAFFDGDSEFQGQGSGFRVAPTRLELRQALPDTKCRFFLDQTEGAAVKSDAYQAASGIPRNETV